jgi:hypothetical protein
VVISSLLDSIPLVYLSANATQILRALE